MRLSTTWNWFLVAFIILSCSVDLLANPRQQLAIPSHLCTLLPHQRVSFYFVVFFCSSFRIHFQEQTKCLFSLCDSLQQQQQQQPYHRSNWKGKIIYSDRHHQFIFVFLWIYSFQKTVTHFAVVVLYGATSPATKHKKLKRFRYFGHIWCSCVIGLRMHRSLIVWVSRCRVSRWNDTWRNVAFSQWVINTSLINDEKRAAINVPQE